MLARSSLQSRKVGYDKGKPQRWLQPGAPQCWPGCLLQVISGHGSDAYA